MKKFWEQLKPQERRAVAAVGIVFFLVLNYFMVWPRFKEWNLNKARMLKAEQNIRTYQAELVHKDEYAHRIQNFDSDTVQLEDQDTHFENFILDRALENHVTRENESPMRKTPFEFFVEKQVTLQTLSSEPGLVNFLYSLGSSNSMMRVKSLIVHPADLNRYQLHADIVIVASYQKTTPNAPAKPAANAATRTTAATPASASKPAASAPRPGAPNPNSAPPGPNPNAAARGRGPNPMDFKDKPGTSK
jgi:hypothetical protein